MDGSAESGVSIVIPAFNEERAVERQIEQIHAAMRHTARCYEIVVVATVPRTAPRTKPRFTMWF